MADRSDHQTEYFMRLEFPLVLFLLVSVIAKPNIWKHCWLRWNFVYGCT